MKRISIIICICLLASAISAQTFDQSKAIQEISSAASSIQSLQCDFVQTKSLKLLGDKMVSNGQMYCQQPDKLKWQYVSPYQYTFILNGAKVQIKKGNRSDVIDTNQNKLFKEIARIMMNSVLGKCLTDARDFNVSVVKQGDFYIATLSPLKKELKQMFAKILLHYDISSKMVTKVQLFEKNGDNTLIELNNIKKNIKIDADLFKVN